MPPQTLYVWPKSPARSGICMIALLKRTWCSETFQRSRGDYDCCGRSSVKEFGADVVLQGLGAFPACKAGIPFRRRAALQAFLQHFVWRYDRRTVRSDPPIAPLPRDLGATYVRYVNVIRVIYLLLTGLTTTRLWSLSDVCDRGSQVWETIATLVS